METDQKQPPILYGEFEHSLDSKNRLCINAEFRELITPEELEKGLVITKGYDQCLSIYTKTAFDETVAKLRQVPYSDPNFRAFRRDFLRKAHRVVPDAQGRIVLPERLKREANIVKECVEVGADDHIEIWAKEVYEKYWNENQGRAEEAARSVPL